VRVLAGLRGALRDPLACFLWIWFGVVFVLFSVSRTQLPHYILYGATPLFILMARHRSLLRSRALAYGPALGLFLLLFFLPDVVEALRSRVTNAYLAETLAAAGGAFGVSYRMATGAAVLLAAYVLWRPPSDVGFGLAALGVAGALVLSTYVVPALSQIQQGPIAAAAHFVAGENATVVASGINAPSFSVYRSAVTPVRTPQPGELALVRVDRLGELPPNDIVFVHAGIRVVRIRGR
jgi:4-amino-4-deoxy-L-arabinose transferase-like glycosyltransferase